MRFFTAFL